MITHTEDIPPSSFPAPVCTRANSGGESIGNTGKMQRFFYYGYSAFAEYDGVG